MAKTYETICSKIGYDPLSYEYEFKIYISDSGKNPFKPLSHEEVDFLFKYLINNHNKLFN